LSTNSTPNASIETAGLVQRTVRSMQHYNEERLG
jgi:hypothetical protein